MAAQTPSDNLFIQNLPVGLQQEQCQEIFAQYGEVQGCKVMDNGTKCAALVRFSSPDEALSVKELLDGFIPQGLEAPVNVRYANNPKGQGKGAAQGGVGFSPTGTAANGAHAMSAGGMGKGGGGAVGGIGMSAGGMSHGAQGAVAGGVSMDQICDALEASGALPADKSEEGTLFVGNLPPDCNDKHLYRMFAPFGPVAAVRAMNNPGTNTCKGIGFVNYSVSASAQVAIDTMNGMTMPDGRNLNVKIKSPSPGGQGFQGGAAVQGFQGGAPGKGFQGGAPGKGFQGGTPGNAKTALCTFHQRGHCQRGESCHFAHGPEELVGGGGQAQQQMF